VSVWLHLKILKMTNFRILKIHFIVPIQCENRL